MRQREKDKKKNNEQNDAHPFADDAQTSEIATRKLKVPSSKVNMAKGSKDPNLHQSDIRKMHQCGISALPMLALTCPARMR